MTPRLVRRGFARSPHRVRPRSWSVRLRRFIHIIGLRMSSSLTRRIVVLNLGGLLVLLLLFLYVNQFREGLIDARVQSLQAQGEIIAAAIAASAAVQTDALTIDPEKLLQLAPGQPAITGEDENSALEFSINPDRVGPVLRRLVSPTRTRARVYDLDADLLLDTRAMSLHSTVFRRNGGQAPRAETLVAHLWGALRRRLDPPDTSVADDGPLSGAKVFPEVGDALNSQSRSVVRTNPRGETIVSVAVPIMRARSVRGALLLSTQGGDIDGIIASERWAMVRVFLVAASVTFLLSLFLAGTIAGPMRRLAEAAERVRRGGNSRQEIPDFTSRSDEIGHLSGALRDMTHALYARMEAIESFAADVAHELKNPLTSLRSAVETLPRIKTDESRERLLTVIQHDVRRLDRLISDISDASRLDAELARGGQIKVDMAALATAVVEVANGVSRRDDVRVTLEILPPEGGDAGLDGFKVEGHDSRLGQVLNNLIDNARSFSPQGGTVRVCLRHALNPARDDDEEAGVEIVVDDDGPGIPQDAVERIFERFYTDRPQHGFGQNSGLGLSISRQIAEAHGGVIWAENRVLPGHESEVELDPEGNERIIDLAGARFTLWLPLARS
ncbi:stimulus-sensing domain-containing protein [Lichenihabitans sp. Uapishka_5]|uniref:stimulus-sensing domain-containing protein n=1 Tax=Lichenihabitans sp. Uapishka_5 TaxID=3037302 RepID=UPI0029E82934|nr:stimulus-sensing domain-containing protein [Lichenihabitans sp. Uapishka_5]MDX7950101.1 stimulus-sensing domain-containing protein [Lichenihabitans sp. Uapishka_5]